MPGDLGAAGGCVARHGFGLRRGRGRTVAQEQGGGDRHQQEPPQRDLGPEVGQDPEDSAGRREGRLRRRHGAGADRLRKRAGDKRSGLGREAVAELEAHGHPVVVGAPKQVGAEDQQGQQAAQVRPGGAQGLGVATHQGPQEDGTDQNHVVLGQQPKPGGKAGPQPAPAVPLDRRQCLVEAQGPAEGQHRVRGGQDAPGEPRCRGGDQHQGDQGGRALSQPAAAIEGGEHDQGEGARNDGAEACRQGGARGEEARDAEQSDPRRVVEVSPGQGARPVEVIGLILGHRQELGHAQVPQGDQQDQGDQVTGRGGCRVWVRHGESLRYGGLGAAAAWDLPAVAG